MSLSAEGLLSTCLATNLLVIDGFKDNTPGSSNSTRIQFNVLCS